MIVEDSEAAFHRLESAVADIPGLRLVASAPAPAEAIELISTFQPAILILDMFLLEGSGLDVLEAIQARGIRTNIVVVTNAPSEMLCEACRALGARFFFDKSLEFDQLQGALRVLQAEAA